VPEKNAQQNKNITAAPSVEGAGNGVGSGVNNNGAGGNAGSDIMAVANQPFKSLASPSKTMPAISRKHVVTKGEKRFDWQTYMGVGFWVNAAISVAAVYWAERTKMGQKTIIKTGEWLGKTLGVNADKAASLAKKTLFLSGGFAVLAPMKWMEDNKAQRVKALNREIYGDQAKIDPVITQSEKELEDAPKQGWASLVSSRALALAPFYVLMGLLWDNKSKISRATNAQFHEMGKDALQVLEKTKPAEFNKIAGQGIFFERPIVFMSRKASKLWAGITGDKQAIKTIEIMEKAHSGALHSADKTGHLAKANDSGKASKLGKAHTGATDTAATALTHISISEMVTSYVVAKAVYFLSRIMGPVFSAASKTGGSHYDREDIYKPAPLAAENSPVISANEALEEDGSILQPNSQQALADTQQAPSHEQPASRIAAAGSAISASKLQAPVSPEIVSG
jgi:hypothetical protein